MDLRKEPRRYSRLRMFLYRGIVFLFSRLMPGRLLYARSLSKGAFDVIRINHGCEKEDRCFRVVQLSDFHAGPYLDSRSLDDVVREVNGLEPHVIVLTGDFITHGPKDVDLILDALSRFEGVLAAFAVFGNHDYRFRRERYMQDRFLEADIRTLRNEASLVTWEDRRYWFLGIEDMEEGKYPDLGRALDSVRGEGFRILLSHNPDAVKSLSPGSVDLVLSGHTHGGPTRLLGFKTLTAGYEGEFLAGAYIHNGTRLYVNRGIGCLVVPARFGMRPEVTLHLFPGPAR